MEKLKWIYINNFISFNIASNIFQFTLHILYGLWIFRIPATKFECFIVIFSLRSPRFHCTMLTVLSLLAMMSYLNSLLFFFIRNSNSFPIELVYSVHDTNIIFYLVCILAIWSRKVLISQRQHIFRGHDTGMWMPTVSGRKLQKIGLSQVYMKCISCFEFGWYIVCASSVVH